MRRPHLRRLGGAAVVSWALTAAAACARDAPPDASTAAVVCQELRDHANELIAVANRAVTGINERSPVGRRDAIVAGFVEAEAVATAHAAAIERVPISPSMPERTEILEILRAGAVASADALRRSHDAFTTDVVAIEDADVNGGVGRFFNDVEKAMSVAEPAIGGLDRRDLQSAFLDEPSCRHVVQPFRLDEPVASGDTSWRVAP